MSVNIVYMFSCYISYHFKNMFKGPHGRLAIIAKCVTLLKHCINLFKLNCKT